MVESTTGDSCALNSFLHSVLIISASLRNILTSPHFSNTQSLLCTNRKLFRYTKLLDLHQLLHSSSAYINKHKALVITEVYAHQHCTERNGGEYIVISRKGNIIPRKGVERAILAAAFPGFVIRVSSRPSKPYALGQLGSICKSSVWRGGSYSSNGFQ